MSQYLTYKLAKVVFELGRSKLCLTGYRVVDLYCEVGYFIPQGYLNFISVLYLCNCLLKPLYTITLYSSLDWHIIEKENNT